MSAVDLLKFAGVLVLMPCVFYVMYFMLKGVSDLGTVFSRWKREGEDLEDVNFFCGDIYCQLEIPLSRYYMLAEKRVCEVRDGHSQFVYRYKWLNKKELIFIKKVSYTSSWAEVFRGTGVGFMPILTTKNHVQIAGGKAHITSRLMKGGRIFLWFWTLIPPSVAAYAIYRTSADLSASSVLLCIFICLFSIFLYYMVNVFPKKEIAYAFRLIATDQYP